MESAVMKVYVHSPIERVWEVISNHEGYPEMFEAVNSCTLLKEGEDDRNGVGAVRDITVKNIRGIEDIITFEPPRRLDYRMKKPKLPIEHELGRMDLIPRGEGTELHWVTTFNVKLPLIGGLLERLLRMYIQDVFYEGLMELKEKLEAEAYDQPEK